ncbi:DUF5522 domain-containing protein [Sedimenticola thiotaurini]|uniref:Uncharacterized protein n=1 Tax=Sedimenticola thiotaurini TaxID=1543721 RepID=A0A0F7JYZ6_9GAMM|nr:DUF5522 domain-containing protein [Sedimenticola thiotaurini]AKH20100.1 hypothetical protein AAY24_06735 [Sedimenticola thiotaurini]
MREDNETDGTDPWPLDELIEGRHYYWEDGLMVFTECYHRSRGNCCGSACRHCPFDHINVKPVR